MAASNTTVEEIIREFYVDIKKELNIKAIVDVLYARRIVDFDLMRDIEREATSSIGNQLFLDHLIRNGTLETLTRFCHALEETARSEILPHHRYWSEKLKRKLTTERSVDSRCKSSDSSPPSPQDELLSSSLKQKESLFLMENTQSVHPHSPLSSQGESTRAISTMDERSRKIKEIVDKYRNGEGELFLPSNPDLEDELDDIMGTLRWKLSSADPRVISRLHGMVRRKYRRYIHGVRPIPFPPVPDTAKGLCEFIEEKSTIYEILLVHHAVEVLGHEELKKDLQEYESKLANHLKEMLKSCKRRRVTLPLHKDHTHMAVVISKEQVLLSLVLEMKEYFSKYLQLEETLFEGFEEGCTVLFFSILNVDAALLSPKVLSHLSELKRMFETTHVIVFGYFACDLEKATIELLSDSENVSLFKTEKIHLENELVQLEEEKTILKNDLQSRRMKLKVKEEELDQSKKETEMFKNSTVKLAKQKFKLEDELRRKSELGVEMGKEIDALRGELKKMRREKAKAEKTSLMLKVFQSDSLLEGKKLRSTQLPPLPIPTCHATAVVIEGKIYVSGGLCGSVKRAKLVQVYDTITSKWTTLPPSPIYNSESTIVKGQLTLIGGRYASTGITNSTITWDEEKRQWFPMLPLMPTERSRPCIIHCNNFMLVAGGLAGDKNTLLDTVDIFNMDTFQWVTSNSIKLPLAMEDMRASTSNGNVYITSAMDSPSTITREAYTVPVDEVVNAINKKQAVKWIQVHDTPHFASGLVVGTDCPIVVGGVDGLEQPTSDISIYDPTTDHWTNVGQCIIPHLQSCAIAVTSSSFVVIGGRTNPKDTQSSFITNFEVFYM